MPADLSPPDALAWLRLVLGTLLFLLPGLAAADRVFGRPVMLWTAPVWSFSMLPLAAIALDFGLGVPIGFWTTAAIAAGLAAWLGWRRAIDIWWWMAGAPRRTAATAPPGPDGWPTPADAPPAARSRRVAAVALLAIIPMVMLVHGLQHVPGDSPADEPSSWWDAYPSLGRHAVDALQGDQYPYPIHVDEHIHLAYMAQIERQGSADIVDPYTKLPGQQDLFSVQGMRSERGWQVAIVQFHELSGLSVAALSRWLPAIWAGFLGLTVFLALRPAPGAVAAAALVAVLPSDVRFLGVAYLIPSPFALPWLFVVLMVAQRASGAGRFFGLLLLLTAAHFMHLVIGVTSILVAVAGTMTRDDARGRRASMLAAALLPLLWILPTTLRDARDAVTAQNTLPFDTQFLGIPGIGVYLLAGAGSALAWLWPQRANQPHRAMSLAAIPLALSLLLSIRFQHASDATYGRLVFAFMLMLVGLASYGLADGVRRLWALGRVHAPAAPHAIVAVVVAALLAAPLTNHMTYEPYRVHGEASWAAAQTLANSDVGPDDVFLSHPWEAPVYNSMTGAVPFTVLRPGSPPERADAWQHYVRSGGADAAWLAARDITVVVAGVPPNAPHRELGPNVYRVLPA